MPRMRCPHSAVSAITRRARAASPKATIWAEPLRQHRVTVRDLAAVRRRRLFPTAVTQAVQRAWANRWVGPLLRGGDPTPPAALFGLIDRFPWLSFLPAYFIGVGVRPERAPSAGPPRHSPAVSCPALPAPTRC